MPIMNKDANNRQQILPSNDSLHVTGVPIPLARTVTDTSLLSWTMTCGFTSLELQEALQLISAAQWHVQCLSSWPLHRLLGSCTSSAVRGSSKLALKLKMSTSILEQNWGLLNIFHRADDRPPCIRANSNGGPILQTTSLGCRPATSMPTRVAAAPWLSAKVSTGSFWSS